MRNIYLIVLLLSFQMTHAQWTKITAINKCVELAVHNNTIYAASDSGRMYVSHDAGLVWETLHVSTSPITITAIAFLDNKIYVSSYLQGIFRSSDSGSTWHNYGQTPNWVSGLTVNNNILYASTLGTGVTFLDSTTDHWTFMNDSLPDYSVNVQDITGSTDYLMIPAGSNGTFYTFDSVTHSWIEGYYYGRLRAGLQIEKMINSKDTIFAVNANRIIRSNNAGADWMDDKVGSHDGADRIICAGVSNYFTVTNMPGPGGIFIQQRNKSAAAGTTWETDEEFLPGYAYDLIEYDSMLFLGKEDGLYVKVLHTHTPTGIAEQHALKNHCNVYPNPSTNGMIHLDSEREVVSIEMVNTLGEAVYQTAVNKMQFQFQTDLPKGIYMLRINFREAAEQTKMLISE